MKIKDYFFDKLYLILTYFITSLVLAFMLKTIGVINEVIIIALVSLTIILMTVLIVEYYRRYQYYKDLDKILKSLDKPYLIFEMFPDNSFIDAKIFEEVVRTANYAMVNHVNLHKMAFEDYKNYIELWVHEIKTPLTAAKLIVENQNQDSNILLEELDKVEYYVMQALFYARSSAVSKDYQIKPVNLETSIRKVIKDLSSSFIKKDIKLDLSLLDKPVYTDSKWFEFILKQILINSLQYTNKGDKVEIVMVECDQSVKLDIIDSGIGIDEADLKRIFDKGFTGKSGRSYSQATGMGLYLVSELSKALSIKVVAKSKDGTTISLTFPQTDMHFNS